MKSITSSKNPIIQKVKALQSAKGRKEANAFWVDGEHMVTEALKTTSVTAIFVQEEKQERFSNLLSSLSTCEVYCVPAPLLMQMAQVKTPQGIGAICAFPPVATLADLGERVVLLENVQDPGNVGTIIRTMDAVGFTGLIVTPQCADVFSPKVLRATMGSVFRVPIYPVPSAEIALTTLHNAGFISVGGALIGTPFYERPSLQAPLCLLIGNEGAGLQPETQQQCTHLYRLPMKGEAESLNAAIAASVFMYDLQYRG